MAKKILYAILTLCLTLPFIAPGKGLCFELTLLHTNDIHAYLAGKAASMNIPCYTSKEPNCVGGFPRIAQVVLDTRQTDRNVILLDAGDQFLGTPFYSDFIKTPGEMPFIKFMNRLGYDAMSPGNHEFDDGCEVFLGAVKNLRFPVVASNLTYTDPEMQKNLRPWVIIEREGKRIGIIGLALEATARTSNPCASAAFSDEEESLRKAVQEIKKHNVFTIIALSHAGTPSDITYATKVDGISIFVSGHTHHLLSNTRREESFGPYPIVKKSPSGKPVLIVTASQLAVFIGRLRVTFDKNGVPQKWSGDTIYLDKPLSNDPAVQSMAKLLDYYGEPISKRMNEKVGEIGDPQNPKADTSQKYDRVIDDVPTAYCRKYETLTGNLILNAVMTKAKEEQADIGLVCTGIIRASLPVGVVTKKDINTVLAIPDELVVGDVTGKTLKEAFENSVSGTHILTVNLGRFLYVGGMRLTYDPLKPVGDRVKSIEILGDDGQYTPIDPEKTYRVVITKYVAEGNEGFAMLKGIDWKPLNVTVEKVVEDYIRENSPVCVKKDGRIVNLGQPPAPPGSRKL